MSTRIDYWPIPTQIKFWHSYEDFTDLICGRCIGGIGYQNIIICGETGDVIDPNDVYNAAPDGIDPIRETNWEWIDLSDMIKGEIA